MNTAASAVGKKNGHHRRLQAPQQALVVGHRARHAVGRHRLHPRGEGEQCGAGRTVLDAAGARCDEQAVRRKSVAEVVRPDPERHDLLPRHRFTHAIGHR